MRPLGHFMGRQPTRKRRIRQAARCYVGPRVNLMNVTRWWNEDWAAANKFISVVRLLDLRKPTGRSWPEVVFLNIRLQQILLQTALMHESLKLKVCRCCITNRETIYYEFFISRVNMTNVNVDDINNSSSRVDAWKSFSLHFWWYHKIFNSCLRCTIKFSAGRNLASIYGSVLSLKQFRSFNLSNSTA